MKVTRASTVKSALLAVSAIALASAGISMGAAKADEVTTTRTVEVQHMQPNALDSAARLIEKQSGGRVLEIREAGDNPANGFVAVVSLRDGSEVVRLDPANMMVRLNGAEIPPWTDRYASFERARDVRHARFDIGTAIHRAARDVDAVPVDAHFTERGAIMAYDIHLVGRDREHTVVIDANTGERIASPNEFEG